MSLKHQVTYLLAAIHLQVWSSQKSRLVNVYAWQTGYKDYYRQAVEDLGGRIAHFQALAVTGYFDCDDAAGQKHVRRVSVRSPCVLSTRVLSPCILWPCVFSSRVLWPFVFSSRVLWPFVLASRVLWPRVFRPCVLWPNSTSKYVTVTHLNVHFFFLIS